VNESHGFLVTVICFNQSKGENAITYFSYYNNLY
jgi:hypothetical protein